MTPRPADIRILSAGAPKTGVRLCAEAHQQRTGQRFQIVFATAPEIETQLRESPSGVDLVVAPSRAFAEGPVADTCLRETRVPLGSIATGVAVRRSANALDLSSSDAFRAALLAADEVIYNRASSGRYIEQMIDTLDLTRALADRTIRPETGQSAMEHLAKTGSKRALAFGQVTEIKRLEPLGLRLVGPLPAALANQTAYSAALTHAAKTFAPAQDFLRFLRSKQARKIFVQTGIE